MAEGTIPCFRCTAVTITVKANSASLGCSSETAAPGTGRGDIVSGHVVADLEQHRLPPSAQPAPGNRAARRCWAPYQLLAQRFLLRQRRLQHRVFTDLRSGNANVG